MIVIHKPGKKKPGLLGLRDAEEKDLSVTGVQQEAFLVVLVA